MTVRAPHHLLPPQSTALERAVVDNAPNWDALTAPLGAIESTRPDNFKPWLAAEWELAQFAQYFANVDALLTAALPWLFLRGTPASVRRALSWLGYDNVGIEEDGPYLHIDLGRIASDAEIARIRHVVTTSLPAHVRFYRVLFAYDLRPIALDHGPDLDDGLLDDDSGVPVAGTDLKASFGAWHDALINAPALQACTAHQTHLRTSDISYDDVVLFDVWALDSEIQIDASSGTGQLHASGCNALGALGIPRAVQGLYRNAIAAHTAPAPRGTGVSRQTTVLSSPMPQRGWTGAWAGSWVVTYDTAHN